MAFGYMATPEDVVNSAQLDFRGYFEELDHPSSGTFQLAGRPVPDARNALEQREGATAGRAQRGDSGRRAGIEPGGDRTHGERGDGVAPCPGRVGDSMNPLPLEGIRIIDLSMIWAGPHCTRLLGDMGAEVIKVESVTRLDPTRGPVRPRNGRRIYPGGDPGEKPYNRSGGFHQLHRNKLGITLNLKTEEGVSLFKQLASVSDVVIDNFSLGVMKSFGLDYDTLKAERPDIIVISMPAFGNTGPDRSYVGFGVTIEPMAGVSHLTGYDGAYPMRSGGNHADPVNGLHAAGAVLAALWSRRSTGKGPVRRLLAPGVDGVAHRRGHYRVLAEREVPGPYRETGTRPPRRRAATGAKGTTSGSPSRWARMRIGRGCATLWEGRSSCSRASWPDTPAGSAAMMSWTRRSRSGPRAGTSTN